MVNHFPKGMKTLLDGSDRVLKKHIFFLTVRIVTDMGGAPDFMHVPEDVSHAAACRVLAVFQ